MVNCCYDIPALKSLELFWLLTSYRSRFCNVLRNVMTLQNSNISFKLFFYVMPLRFECDYHNFFDCAVDTVIQVYNSHSSHDRRLFDYCDGTLYKGCALFWEDPCTLQVQLYYDEVDLRNPIGSRSAVHKLGVSCIALFYWCIKIYRIEPFKYSCTHFCLYIVYKRHPPYFLFCQ